MSPARASGASEERGGRIAAGCPDDGNRRVDEGGELGAVELRQPVRSRRRELRRGMLEPVPARVVGRIAQPEVRSEVDHRGPVTCDLGNARRGGPVGQRQEHGVRLGHRQIDCQARPREMAMRVLDRLLIAIPALQPHQLNVRVARQDADELGTDVPGRADDRDADAPLAAVGGDAACGTGETSRAVRRDRSRCVDAHAHGRARPLTGAGSRLGSDGPPTWFV